MPRSPHRLPPKVGTSRASNRQQPSKSPHFSQSVIAIATTPRAAPHCSFKYQFLHQNEPHQPRLLQRQQNSAPRHQRRRRSWTSPAGWHGRRSRRHHCDLHPPHRRRQGMFMMCRVDLCIRLVNAARMLLRECLEKARTHVANDPRSHKESPSGYLRQQCRFDSI